MQGDLIVEKVKPDPLNLSVNTAVGSKYIKHTWDLIDSTFELIKL